MEHKWGLGRSPLSSLERISHARAITGRRAGKFRGFPEAELAFGDFAVRVDGPWAKP